MKVRLLLAWRVLPEGAIGSRLFHGAAAFVLPINHQGASSCVQGMVWLLFDHSPYTGRWDREVGKWVPREKLLSSWALRETATRTPCKYCNERTWYGCSRSGLLCAIVGHVHILKAMAICHSKFAEQGVYTLGWNSQGNGGKATKGVSFPLGLS